VTGDGADMPFAAALRDPLSGWGRARPLYIPRALARMRGASASRCAALLRSDSSHVGDFRRLQLRVGRNLPSGTGCELLITNEEGVPFPAARAAWLAKVAHRARLCARSRRASESSPSYAAGNAESGMEHAEVSARAAVVRCPTAASHTFASVQTYRPRRRATRRHRGPGRTPPLRHPRRGGLVAAQR
jgi:hypothetical protein